MQSPTPQLVRIPGASWSNSLTAVAENALGWAKYWRDRSLGELVFPEDRLHSVYRAQMRREAFAWRRFSR